MKQALHLAATTLVLALVVSLLSSTALDSLKEGVASYEAGNLPLAVKEPGAIFHYALTVSAALMGAVATCHAADSLPRCQQNLIA